MFFFFALRLNEFLNVIFARFLQLITIPKCFFERNNISFKVDNFQKLITGFPNAK